MKEKYNFKKILKKIMQNVNQKPINFDHSLIDIYEDNTSKDL